MAATYEFQVAGHLDEHWSGRLGGLELRHDGDGTSVLSGALADQSQLHGVLAGLRDVGAPLLAVRMVSEPAGAKDGRAASVGGAPSIDSPVFVDGAVSVDGAAAVAAAGTPLTGLSWPKQTERLTLRPARPEDADAVWAFRHLDSVCQWQSDGPMAIEAFRARFAEADRIAVTLVVEHDGEVIGDLMLRVEDAWGQTDVVDDARGTQAELAWTLHPAYEGKGFGTEAVRAMIRICLSELGIRRIVAFSFADNERSWRLMERVGMRRELHAVADALHRSGEWLDTYGYALLRDDAAVD